MDTNTTQSDITAEQAGRSTWIPERVVGKFLPVPSWKRRSHVFRGVPERTRILQEQREREELDRMSNPAGNLERRKVPAGEKSQEMHEEAAAKNPGDFSSGKLGESKTAFTGDAKSCFSSLSELPLVQAPPSTYTPRSSTCGWCPASSGTLSAAFIGGKARPVSVATQILAASPRSPPPRSRPQTRRERSA